MSFRQMIAKLFVQKTLPPPPFLNAFAHLRVPGQKSVRMQEAFYIIKMAIRMRRWLTAICGDKRALGSCF